MRQNKAAKLQDIKQTWRRQAKKGTRPERKRIPYISKQINARLIAKRQERPWPEDSPGRFRSLSGNKP